MSQNLLDNSRLDAKREEVGGKPSTRPRGSLPNEVDAASNADVAVSG